MFGGGFAGRGGGGRGGSVWARFGGFGVELEVKRGGAQRKLTQIHVLKEGGRRGKMTINEGRRRCGKTSIRKSDIRGVCQGKIE